MTFVMCTRRSAIGEVEAEPVVVEVYDGTCSLILDDGEALDFNPGELVDAICSQANADARRREAA